MKIYQVVKYGGEWEDSYEIVVGTYIVKKNADLKLLELESKKIEGLKRGRRCESCENHWEESQDKKHLQEMGLELRKKCRFAKISIEKYKVPVISHYWLYWVVFYAFTKLRYAPCIAF